MIRLRRAHGYEKEAVQVEKDKTVLFLEKLQKEF